MTVTGSALVYFGNHYALPILSLFLLWGALATSTTTIIPRLTAESHSHGWADRPRAPPPPVRRPYHSVPWTSMPISSSGGRAELAVPETPAQTHIPVFVIAAEGGGLRAAYWTA